MQPNNVELQLPNEAAEFVTHAHAVGVIAAMLLTAHRATITISSNMIVVSDDRGIPRVQASTTARREGGLSDPSFDQLVKSAQALQQAANWSPSDAEQGHGPTGRTEAIVLVFDRITGLLPDGVNRNITSTISPTVAHALILMLVTGTHEDVRVIMSWLK